MQSTAENKAKVLIADDSDISRVMLSEILYEQCEITEAVDGVDALEKLREMPEKPDLILLDVMMPQMDGYAVMDVLKKEPELKSIPVMYITSADDEYKGLVSGAADYIGKPFDPQVIQLRVGNQINTRRLHRQLEHIAYNKTLELTTTKEIILETLANMVEYRSLESSAHINRIKKLMEIVVSQIIDEHSYEDILVNFDLDAMIKASAMHDIGKIAIPDSILLKPGRLTADEFKVIETHTTIGSKIFKRIFDNSPDEYFNHCYDIALSHHERWDGKGYPQSLAGGDIPLSARMLAIVDVYDALVSDRCYKEAFSHERAMEIIGQGAGTQFDPAVVSAFLAANERIKEVMAGD